MSKPTRIRPAAPEVVPFSNDIAERITALRAGQAIGPITVQRWTVTAGHGPIPFATEDDARAYWHKHGGDLTVTTSQTYTLSTGWHHNAIARTA